MSDRSCHSGTVRAGWIESCREIAMKPSMVPFDRTGPSTGSGQTGQDMPFVVTWSNHERIARSQAHPLTGSGQARAHHERMVGRVCHGPAHGSTGSPRTGLGARHERAWELTTNGPGSSPRTGLGARHERAWELATNGIFCSALLDMQHRISGQARAHHERLFVSLLR